MKNPRCLWLGIVALTLNPIVGLAAPAIPQNDVQAKLDEALKRAHVPSGNMASVRAAASVTSFVNGASFTPQISPGAWATLFTSADNSLVATIADAVPFPAVLATRSIEINGSKLPLLYAGPGQVNAQIPYELPPGNYTAIFRSNNASAESFPIQILKAAPGFFLWGDNMAIAQTTNGALITQTNPAHRGDFIVAYLTGGGALDNAASTGKGATYPPLYQTAVPYSATIAGQNATVAFLGLTPGFAGLWQANISVPNSIPTGLQPLEITVDGITSKTAYLFIQ